MKTKICLALSLLALIVLSFLLWLRPSEKQVADSEGQTLVARRGRIADGQRRDSKAKIRRPGRGQSKNEIRIHTTEDRRDAVLDEIDEALLTDLQKAVLQELRDALEGNDIRAVRRAIAKFYLSEREGGLGGRIPTILRKQAVQALGWFGSSAISDMIPFMADADPQVEQEAFDQFELALEDWNIGDRATSRILQQVLSAVNDAERIDSLLMNLSRMRNSVKAETILAVLETGTDVAKSVMRENVEFYTESVPTSSDTEPTMEEIVKSVKDWAEYNPDTESDEEFFGPQKSE